MTDFRTLCAELIDWAKLLVEIPDPPVTRNADELSDLLARCRAALSQPEPQGPVPVNSLVERVATQILNDILYEKESDHIARTAIREVAAWLSEQGTN